MDEALRRILGLKAHLELHKKSRDELCPSAEQLPDVLNRPEYKAYSSQVSRDCLTLVKYLDEGVLPLRPEKTKRIMIVPIKGADGPMAALMAMAMAGRARRRPENPGREAAGPARGKGL